MCNLGTSQISISCMDLGCRGACWNSFTKDYMWGAGILCRSVLSTHLYRMIPTLTRLVVRNVTVAYFTFVGFVKESDYNSVPTFPMIMYILKSRMVYSDALNSDVGYCIPARVVKLMSIIQVVLALYLAQTTQARAFTQSR